MSGTVMCLLVITGSEADIAQVRERVARPYVAFRLGDKGEKEWRHVVGDFLLWNCARPAEDRLSDYWFGWATGSPCWYRWNVANWGTLFEVGEESVRSLESAEPGSLIYRFFSAYAPPLEALRRLSRDYAGVEFFLEAEECPDGRTARYLFLAGKVSLEDDGMPVGWRLTDVGKGDV